MTKTISEYMEKFLQEMEESKKRYTIKDKQNKPKQRGKGALWLDKNYTESDTETDQEQLQVSSKDSDQEQEDNEENDSEHSLEINFDQEVSQKSHL